MAIKLPGNIRIMIDSEAAININIPDHYLRKEYLRHPDYIPRDGWIVIDAGAYIGIYTIWASRLVGNSGLVIALEPNPLAFRWLLSNIELNRCVNVKALPYALGDELTKSTLYVADANPEASSLIKSHVIKNPAGRYSILCSFMVPIVTLDYLIDNSLNLIGKRIQRVNLMRIDIEGYEMKVLKGARKSLEKGLIDRLVVEVHIDQANTAELARYLIQFGYTLDKTVRFGGVKDVIYMRLRH